MTPKNVLIVSGSAIHPAVTGGTVHTLGIARSMARLGHTVRLYGFAGRADQYQRGVHALDYEIEPRLNQHVHLGLLNGILQTLVRRLGAPRIWQYHLMRLGWVPKSLKQQVDWADVVFGDMPHTPPMPGRWGAKPWVMISHNLEWRILEQGEPKDRRWAWWMRKVEASAPARYRDIVAVTEEDRDFFRSHDLAQKCQLPIVGCGVEPEAYQVPPGTREQLRQQLGIAEDERVVVFAGSRFLPNLEALAAIRSYAGAQQQWLQQKRVRIVVVGSVVETPFSEGVVLGIGRVPEIAPYFALADAGLNPVVSGSGANVKLFEYMAVRLPIIATTFGVRGSDLVAERDYLHCEPQDFTTALETLCAYDRAYWQHFADAVWQRHKHTCEMGELVSAALPRLGVF